jgi:hypothetical protein
VDLVAGRQERRLNTERRPERGELRIDAFDEDRPRLQPDRVRAVVRRDLALPAEGVHDLDRALREQHAQGGRVRFGPLTPRDQRRLISAGPGENPASDSVGHGQLTAEGAPVEVVGKRSPRAGMIPAR